MARASAEILEHTGPAENKTVDSVSQREQLASTPELYLLKGKGTEPSVQSTRLKGGYSMSGSKEKRKERKGKKKRQVFLCRRTVRVKVKSKVIPTSFLKIQGRETFLGAKDRRKRDSQ